MPSARIVAPAPEEDDYLPSVQQSGREDSGSGESYAAISTMEDGVSKVDLEVILRVTHINEDMTGKCFHCGHEGQ